VSRFSYELPERMRRAFADQIADHDKRGGDADADGEPLRSTGL
jgi:hypothetical protein